MNERQLTAIVLVKGDCRQRPTERSPIKYGERPLTTTKLPKRTVGTRQHCGRWYIATKWHDRERMSVFGYVAT